MTNTDHDHATTTAERKAEIVRMRRARIPFEDIGAAFDISRQRAHQIYWDTMKAVPAPEVTALRSEQREIYNDLIDRAYEIANRDHLAVSQGRIVRIGLPTIDPETGLAVIAENEGEPVLDDMPKLAAIREIRALVDSLAKLDGTPVPVKQLLEGATTVKYVIEGTGLEKLT